jgi:cystathionine beta-synthase
MVDNDFSQLPLTQNGRMIGSITQHKLFSELTKNVDLKTQPVGDIMEEALPFIDTSVNLKDLIPQFKTNNPALLVRDFNTEKTHIVTESDVLKTLI